MNSELKRTDKIVLASAAVVCALSSLMFLYETARPTKVEAYYDLTTCMQEILTCVDTINISGNGACMADPAGYYASNYPLCCDYVCYGLGYNPPYGPPYSGPSGEVQCENACDAAYSACTAPENADLPACYDTWFACQASCYDTLTSCESSCATDEAAAYSYATSNHNYNLWDASCDAIGLGNLHCY